MSQNAVRVLREVQRRFEETEERSRPVPPRSPPGPRRTLAVGMATHDDFDGAFFTIEALRLYHREVLDDVELLIIDNHPEAAAAEHLWRLAKRVPNLRYVPFRGWRGTAVRDRVFREANSEYVLCLDSHVLLTPGGLRALLDHFRSHPDTSDLIQGPMLTEAGDLYATHLNPVWSDGMFGQWGLDERGRGDNPAPFEIGMQGLGLFACRRDAWPGFNPRFRGFGGEEGYLHEKVRRAGGRTLCLPALTWVHRFARPTSIPYRPTWDDRIRNYLIGWSELGLDTEPVARHFTEFLGLEVAEPLLDGARAELENPFSVFDAVFCLQVEDHVDDWPSVWQRFDALGMGRIVERFSAIVTPENHHAGCARSHRAMVLEAQRRGLRNVLVIEEDAIFLDTTLDVMRRAVADLRDEPWDLLYLGGVHRAEPTPLPTSGVLEQCVLTCSHAVVYNHTAFDRILADIPEDDAPFAAWLDRYSAIDQYLARTTGEGGFTAVVTNPRVASQPPLLNYRDADWALADRYTIR